MCQKVAVGAALFQIESGCVCVLLHVKREFRLFFPPFFFYFAFQGECGGGGG